MRPNHHFTIVCLLLAVWMFGACEKTSDEAQHGTVLLQDFPLLQQTTDYTCGNTSALMVLRYYGIDDVTEEQLAVAMHTHSASDLDTVKPGTARQLLDYGTSVGEMWNYFAQRTDFRIVASSYGQADSLPLLADTALVGIQAVGNHDRPFADYDEAAQFLVSHIRQGRPVMVCWNLWGGHWTVCIGYDDNATPSFYDDDILVMADPYDTTDGKTEGLTRVSLVQFFYDWFCIMTPKPWQLQPYLVVERIRS
ncbi:MAG: C39 family peptidase [Bacteroidales bacterium]|nr:C39 family peptidase [Bacteroidales bacterium]